MNSISLVYWLPAFMLDNAMTKYLVKIYVRNMYVHVQNVYLHDAFTRLSPHRMIGLLNGILLKESSCWLHHNIHSTKSTNGLVLLYTHNQKRKMYIMLVYHRYTFVWPILVDTSVPWLSIVYSCMMFYIISRHIWSLVCTMSLCPLCIVA